MRFQRAILYIALTTAFSIAAGAPNEDTPLSLDGFSDVPILKSRAIAQAKRINMECSRILALIPRLSPAEDTWLKGELAAKRDLVNLRSGPEYARHALYVHFYDCVVHSRLAAESMTEREQAIAWAQLASRFSATYSDDINYWGERASSQELRELVKRFADWEHVNTYQIIDGIVLPYLVRSK
jgi:hypothetical protein